MNSPLDNSINLFLLSAGPRLFVFRKYVFENSYPDCKVIHKCHQLNYHLLQLFPYLTNQGLSHAISHAQWFELHYMQLYKY